MRLLLLSILLLATPRAHGQRWLEQFTEGAFTFRSEVPIRREPLIRDLKQIHVELKNKLGLTIGKAPIEVLLFRNKRNYMDAVRKQVPNAVNRPALFVKTAEGSRVYAYYSPTVDIDVRHECTHALIHNAVQFIPLWLDEGLAEYFELKAGTRVRPARLNEVRQAIRIGRLLRTRATLPELEAIDDISKMGSQEYRDSWAWVHYLLNDQEDIAPRVLKSYLGEIQKGNPPGAFSKYFARYISHGDARLVQHFRYFR